MPVLSKREFLEALQASRLLSRQQLAAVLRVERGVDDARKIARGLCDRGEITRWQAQKLLDGETSFYVGQYLKLDVLGHGRMGTVYQARRESGGPVVALKVVSAAVLENPTMIARFKREIELVAALRHPNVVCSLDSGCVDGRYFLVTEYVAGQDLLAWIKRERALPIGWVCEGLRQAALGLQHIHERGLIHRDIKPANLMFTVRSVTEIPRVKILDLGLGRFVEAVEERGRLTRDGYTVGTVDFMAPEQIQDGRAADIRSDIYALGCTLFQALARRLPFETESLFERINSKLLKDPPRLEEFRRDAPSALGDVVAWMLERKPEKRPAVPRDVAEALEAFSMARPKPSAAALPAARPAPTGAPAAGGAANRPIAAGGAPAVDASVFGRHRKRWMSRARRPPKFSVILFAASSAAAIVIAMVWFAVAGKSPPVTRIAAREAAKSPASASASPSHARPLPKIEGDIQVGPRGHFRTIGEAIDFVRESHLRSSLSPNTASKARTIKVAGWQTYRERIDIDNSTFQYPKGLRIVCEDPTRAVLAPDGPAPIVRLKGVESYLLDGFECDASGKKAAIELGGYLLGTRLRNLDLRGIEQTGIWLDGAAAFDRPQSRCVLERVDCRADGPAGTGLRFDAQAVPSTCVSVVRCRFFGPFEAAIAINGPSVGIEVRESIASGCAAGVAVRGKAIAVENLTVVNNTFYRLSRGIVFDTMPSAASGGLVVQRNVFVEVAGPELCVETGFDQSAFQRVFARDGLSGNWTSSQPRQALAGQSVDLFTAGGQRGATFQFESTDAGDARFLRPVARAPHRRAGAIILK